MTISIKESQPVTVPTNENCCTYKIVCWLDIIHHTQPVDENNEARFIKQSCDKLVVAVVELNDGYILLLSSK